MKRPRILLSFALLVSFIAACTGSAAPTSRLTTAEAALRAASEVGAAEVPRAALHMKLAQEQIDEAKQLMEDDRNMQAELALRRAQADAELSITIAKEHKTIAETKSTTAKYERLKAQSR